MISKIRIKKQGYLYVTVKGRFKLAALQACLKEMFGVVSATKIRSVLLDVRELTGVPSALERDCLILEEQFLHDDTLAIRLAAVGQNPWPEAVARNRGVQCYAFRENVEDALKWLLNKRVLTIGELTELISDRLFKLGVDYTVIPAPDAIKVHVNKDDVLPVGLIIEELAEYYGLTFDNTGDQLTVDQVPINILPKE